MIVIWFSILFLAYGEKILINFLLHIHETHSRSLVGFEQVISRPHIVSRCGNCTMRENVQTSFLRLQANLFDFDSREGIFPFIVDLWAKYTEILVLQKCVCVSVCGCVRTCARVHIHMEARGNLGSYFADTTSLFFVFKKRIRILIYLCSIYSIASL